MGLSQKQWDALIPSLGEGAQQPYARKQQKDLQRMEADARISQLIKGNELDQAALQNNIKQAQEFAESQGMKPGKYSIQAGKGNIGINPENDDLLRSLQIDNLQRQRDEEAVRKLERRSSDAGTAQAVPALQRGEEAIPGVFTRPNEQVKLKSVGGIKSLAPNFAVPALEKLGLMEKGAGAERTALQELSNVKLYDSSGKAINEAEMKRIQDAMGLRGIFEPQEILSSLRQMGYTVLEKQKGVTAGAPSRIVDKFKGAGGLAGASSLEELIGATAKSRQQPSIQTPPINPAQDPGFQAWKRSKGL